jgi:hypothetical protein
MLKNLFSTFFEHKPPLRTLMVGRKKKAPALETFP